MRTKWGQYSTELFAEVAVDVIQKHDPSQPLFLYLPYQAVHSANSIQPLQAPPEEIEKFKNIQDENRRVFAAMVSSLDQAVGKVGCSSFIRLRVLHHCVNGDSSGVRILGIIGSCVVLGAISSPE